MQYGGKLSRDFEETPEANKIDSYDNLISATFLLDLLKNLKNGGSKAWNVCHKMNEHGNAIGKVHKNPLLDMHQYEVELEQSTYDSFHKYHCWELADAMWPQWLWVPSL